MDVVWIVIGIASLCMPHISAAPLSTSNAWSGLPFPAEALAVCLTLLAAACVDTLPKTRERLPQLALWAAVALIVFECICALALPQYCGSMVLSFVGEMVHAGATALWLTATALDTTEPKDNGRLPVIVQLLLFVSGLAWYVTTAWVRLGVGVWNPSLEASQWLAALLWALPIVTLFTACNLDASGFARSAALPFLGVLLGNRGWLLAAQVAGGVLADVPWQVLFVAPVLSFAAFLSAVVLAEKPDEEELTPEVDEQRTGVESTVPLHLVAGSEKLSSREREVVLLALAGFSTSDVAERCGVTPSTVRTYLMRAYEKMDVVGTSEIAAAMKAVLAPDETSVSEPVKAKTARWFEANTLLSWQLFVAASLAGLSLGLSFTELLFGVRIVVALRFVLSAGLGSAALWVQKRALRLNDGAALVAALAGVLVVVCLVPQGVRAQVLLHGWGAYAVAIGLELVAFVLVKSAFSDELAAIAAVALVGDERILAYLEGRGLKDYVARVALLTARDYPQGGIAKTLGLSRSTVTHYRHRAYEALGVSNKEELVALLEDEAGL